MAITDLSIRLAMPQDRRDLIEPWHKGLTLGDLARDLLPPDGGFSATVNGTFVEVDEWDGYLVPELAQVTFVPEIGFIAEFLAWAIPSLTGFFASTALGPITWGAIFNTVGWVGASYLINSLMPKPKMQEVSISGEDASPALTGKRKAYFRDLGGMVDTPTYRGGRLLAGMKITGPAIIEEPITTIVVLLGSEVTVTRLGNYLVQLN